MKSIKILGAAGNVSVDSYATCIQITKNTLIDAGNIIDALGDDIKYINNIFLSHTHLDHIIDSAFLIDNFFSIRQTSLNIYGLPETIDALKKHIFNNVIWPDFSKINIPNTSKASINFIELELEKTYQVESGITLTPIKANHTVPCCGYIIKKDNASIYFTGDTYKNPAIWSRIDNDKTIKTLIIDVSFPNKLFNIAQKSKHLTPKLLDEDMDNLIRKDCNIYINHIKPIHKKEIVAELEDIGIEKNKILNDGDIITFEDGKLLNYNNSAESRINKLNNIGIALSAEDNLEKLLELIVTESKYITNADGGTLYLLEDKMLKFTVVQTDSMNIKMGGTSAEITWQPLPLYLKDGSPNKKMVAALSALDEKIINIQDVYKAVGFSFDGTKKFDASTGYRSKSMLVVPLKDHEQKIIGVLQLINKQNKFEDTIETFNKDDEKITLSLASQAAVAITNVKLIDGLEKLLESFLKSIIFAIGKKSPYTAAHIQRMVELSVSLAKEIDNDNTVFKDKNFSETTIKQIKIAALMHDIGKLATPEQIIDKSTKLEKIYDRLDLIEFRIELIKKECEISYLKGNISKNEFEQNSKELDEYFKIIEKSNVAATFTSNEDVKLFKKLSKKIYHVNDTAYKVLTNEEAYNLSIQKGTLTDEERQIINEHAKISLDILNKLPFPKKYNDVAQIAGAHHEKLNGKGYPLGLKGDEISFEARILAVADIFEALTASDRPYKKANTITVAMEILHSMVKDGDLDKDIVNFFHSSKLYLKYANKYLEKKIN